MQYLIRSMSTTDYVPAGRGCPEQKPVPYHIFLLKPEKRGGAWWTKSLLRAEIMTFDSEEEAVAERDRLFANDPYTKPQVVPVDQRGVPSFWEAR